MQQVKNKKNTYNFSFTAGALLHAETMLVTDIFIETLSWDITKKKIIEDNLLRTRTKSSSQRLFREISMRLSNLHEKTLELLNNLSDETLEKQIIWISICKTYPFISDFISEVVQEKIDVLDYTLTFDDYDCFFNKKAQWHSEIDNLSPSTQNKVRQVIFRMFKEMSFLSQEDTMLPLLTIDNSLVRALEIEKLNLRGAFPSIQRAMEDVHA